jgi:hypothetical protein
MPTAADTRPSTDAWDPWKPTLALHRTPLGRATRARLPPDPRHPQAAGEAGGEQLSSGRIDPQELGNPDCVQAVGAEVREDLVAERARTVSG